MENIKTILLEEKYILEYIRDMLITFKTKPVEVNNAKYHHNSDYSKASIILKHGILTISELNRLGIKQYSPEKLKIMSDTDSHINGIDSISLSVTGLTDLYRDEFEYDPFDSSKIDFRISNDIRTRRDSTHYGNEYLHQGSIPNDKIKSVDIRLLKLLKENQSIANIKFIIDKYNCLRDIALTIKENKLDIPFRDMSKENLTMDIEELSQTAKLILK